MPGEVDFDRIIRCQDPVDIRKPFGDTMDFGVFVREVTLDDAENPAHSIGLPKHPMVGAAVDLLPPAQYEQQNLIIVTQPFATPIDPFTIQVCGPDGVLLQRKDVFDVMDPGMTVREASEISDAKMARRINTTMQVDSPRVAEATGIMDATIFRHERKHYLMGLLEKAKDPTERLALETRIKFIDRDAIDHGSASPPASS